MKSKQILDKPSLPPSENDQLTIRAQTLVWIFTTLSAFLVYSCVAWFTLRTYRPDIASLVDSANRLLIGSGGTVRPEPVESVLFRIAIIVVPLSIACFYRLFFEAGIVKQIAKTAIFHIICSFCLFLIVVMIYSDFVAKNPFANGGGDIPQTDRDNMNLSNFDFYFGDLFLGNHLFIYTFVIVPFIVFLFLFSKKNTFLSRKFLSVFTSSLGHVILGTFIVLCILICTFNFPYQFNNTYDFSAVYYSMTQVYAGIPLLVDGFTNTYGLYPHFLNLLFQIVGLSIFKFSLVMSLLTGLSFFLNFYCLKQFINNKTILFLGMFSVIFLPFIDNKLTESFDSNFAIFPIRYLVPSVLIFFATIYLKKKSEIIYWSTGMIMAIFVLWNPEFGLVSYGSWVLFNLFIDFNDGERKINFKKTSYHLLASVSILILTTYGYKCCIFLIYGTWPDMSLLWAPIFIFGKYGFGLLPMTLIHPWNIIVLILSLGLVFSVSKWFRGENSDVAAIVFLLSIVGIGTFFYFQGRSHNWNLIKISGISLMILSILCDKLWDVIKKEKNSFALSALFTLCLYIISFSFFEIFYNASRISELVTQATDKSNDKIEQDGIAIGRNFILNNSQIFEKIYVLTIRRFQALYFDAGKRRSAFNPGIIDLFFNKDLKKMETQLRDSSFSVFLTPGCFHDLPFMARSVAGIAATDEYISGDDYMTLLKKRTSGIPANTFFKNDSQLAIYRKYTNDKNGVEARINDAFGIKPITLNPDFSVEILFNSNRQIFPLATLIGNQGSLDSNGFVISRVLNSPKVLFAINSTGFLLPIPYNGWVYCVMSVYPNHFEVYLNGDMVYTHGLVKPLRNSQENLCVGNLGYLHNYLGAISEVAITKSAMDSVQIKATWNEIKDAFTNKR